MTQATAHNYWISSRALFIELNAMGIPDYIQASCVAGAQILVYVKDIIDYDEGHNYRRWNLQASPTFFPTHTKKYVYVAIPRDERNVNATIVFPSEDIDIYGYAHDVSYDEEGNAIDTQRLVGSEEFYYIFLNGIITSSGENGTNKRDWEEGHRIITGYLSSDEAISAGPSESEWYEYSTLDGILTLLKDVMQKAGTKFIQLFAKVITVVSDGKITFEQGGTITGVATTENDISSNEKIVTPAFGKEQWLSRMQDDTAKGNIKFEKDVDVFGNFTAESQSHLKGNVEIGVSPQRLAHTQHWGSSQWGAFVKGIIAGSGGRIDELGNAELESLVIRRFLEVPELRYNRVSVHSGTSWFTKGSGIIESVTITDATHGKIKLKLEDGEVSTIAVDDYCMGIFHNTNGNATQSSDDKHGTLQFSGFTTVYFRIEEITETVYNSEFTYELRPVSSEWSGTAHPSSQMTFACYANPNNDDRQSAILQTTDYLVFLENSTQWTFGPENYYLIFGKLDGFSVWATNKAGNRFLKNLYGRGAMLGQVYMYGETDQFNRLADVVNVSASPILNSDFTLSEGETMTLTAEMKSFDGYKREDATFSIQRFSNNSESDTEWNARRENDIAEGTIELTSEDFLLFSSGETGSGASPIYDPVVQFTITASRKLPSTEGGDTYSVKRDVVLKYVGSYKIEHDNPDPMIAPEESKHYNFTVLDGRRLDATQKVTRWTITRKTSDETADTLWATRDKVKTFAGSIDLIWSPSDPTLNDMDPDESVNTTMFLVTAYFGTVVLAQYELKV